MRFIVRRLERGLGAIDGVVRMIVVLSLWLMTAVLFFNSIGRSLLNVSFVGGPALGRLLVIWLTFLGAYLAVRSGTHITVDVLKRLVSERMFEGIRVLVGCFGALTAGYVTWLSTRFTWTRFAAGQIDPMLEIPSGLFYLPLPLGSFLMTLAFLQLMMQAAVSESAGPPATTRSA